MRNMKMIVEYDGTNYHGFQRQINAITIQQLLEEKLMEITREKIQVISSGRTDAGVHARGQVINFQLTSDIKPFKLLLGMNTLLPDDIVIKQSEEVPLDFHARYSAKNKTYRYSVWNNPFPPALEKNHHYFFPRNLHVGKMQKALRYFLGEHDFFAFCSQKTKTSHFRRTILAMDLREEEEHVLTFMVTADGFLYNMVRMMVGFLLEIGSRQLEPELILDFLENKKEKKTTHVAPAKGLCLMKVNY